jgi:hypothetical protein
MHESADDELRPESDQPAPGSTTDDDLESVPLAERAPRYQAIAERLRGELERSDPARTDPANTDPASTDVGRDA